jgi:hypothetical protein
VTSTGLPSDDKVRAGEQAGERRVAEGLGEEHVLAVAESFRQHLAHARVRVQGEDEGHIGRKLGQAFDPVAYPDKAIAPVLAAVGCDDDDPALAVVEILQFGVGEADVDLRCPIQRVDPSVAGDEDLVDRDVLPDQVLEVL